MCDEIPLTTTTTMATDGVEDMQKVTNTAAQLANRAKGYKTEDLRGHRNRKVTKQNGEKYNVMGGKIQP